MEIEIDERITRLEAKQQVMAASLHAVAAASQDKPAIAQAFRARADSLEALYKAKGADGFLDAFAVARLAVERALDESPSTH